MKLKVFSSAELASKYVAECIAKHITRNNEADKKTVLGLATGNTPICLYKELTRMHMEENLSFEKVSTFNLDEYYPMPKEAEESYHTFMNNHLFGHIDIKNENTHIPSGSIPADQLDSFFKGYEQKIDNSGGIDIQILGIGRTGHIGFNEPGSQKDSTTRLVELAEITRADAAPAFGGKQHVPKQALTMGVSSILKAKKIYLMAWGEKKAEVIQKCFFGDVNSLLPASYLQEKEEVEVILDIDAAKLIQLY